MLHVVRELAWAERARAGMHAHTPCGWDRPLRMPRHSASGYGALLQQGMVRQREAPLASTKHAQSHESTQAAPVIKEDSRWEGRGCIKRPLRPRPLVLQLVLQLVPPLAPLRLASPSLPSVCNTF